MDRIFELLSELAGAAVESLNRRVTLVGGEAAVSQAPEGERVELSVGVRGARRREGEDAVVLHA